MWETEPPPIGHQVIGVIFRDEDDGGDLVAWWTHTMDGFYVSDYRGNLGHRDAMTPADSKGPDAWIFPPDQK
jgi:hypothetical protein